MKSFLDKVKNFCKRKKSMLLQLAGSMGTLILAALIGIMAGLNKTNNVDKYVNEAMGCFGDNNWAALYQHANVVDNDFINEIFFAGMAEQYYGEISEDGVVVENIEKDGDIAKADIQYKTTDGSSRKCVIEFSKGEEIKYLFFPDWKLEIDELIIKDCQITALDDFVVYVDGVELTGNNAVIEADETAGTYTYTIPRLFRGNHIIYIQQDGYAVVSKQITWDENGGSFVFDSADIELDEEYTVALEELSQGILADMYTAIFNERGIEEVSKYFLKDEATLNMVTAIYDNMLAAIKPDDGSTLNSLEVTDITYDVFDYTYPDQLDVTLSYQCTFEARGARSSAGGVREKYTGTSGDAVKLHFIRVDGQWYCNNLDMKCIDYSKPEEVEE